MSTDELTRLLHGTSPGTGTSPGAGLDLADIKRRGRRRHHLRRGATGVASVVAVALVGGTVATLGGRGSDVTIRPAAPERRTTGISAYERRVLDHEPTAYAVNGTVVLPDRSSPQARPGTVTFKRPRIIGDPVALDFHGRAGPGYVMSAETYPAYQRNAPRGSQVVIDPGPAWVACVRFPGEADGCQPSVLAKDTAGRFYRLYGLGTERFLASGAPMELFPDDDWSAHTRRSTLIGGFAGTDATRVELELGNGTRVDAGLAVGTVVAGATLFWARTTSDVVEARAFAANGDLLENHTLRPCSTKVACEVR